MSNNTLTEGGSLIGIKLMTSQFAPSHMTDGMDEVVTVKIFKTILIRIVGVGPTIEVQSGRVFHSILITSIL